MTLLPMYYWATEPKWLFFAYGLYEYNYDKNIKGELSIEIEGAANRHKNFIVQGDLIRKERKCN